MEPSAHNAAARVQRVAQMLLADGYLTAEVDAMLAAIRLVAAADESAGSKLYAVDPADPLATTEL
ncbi:MAG TPA: hypothetical protein VHN81_07455 [Edaphobacter sp.]|nr:hypothetical protein [Edaphobacter sp.]